MKSTFAALLLAFVSASLAEAVGPNLQAKVRLLRDLPLGLYENKATKLPPPKSRDRTLINMTLAVRSLDLDFETGTFRTDGWMSLRWLDPRFQWDPSDYDGIETASLPFSKVWAPEVILHNSLQEKFIYRQVMAYLRTFAH